MVWIKKRKKKCGHEMRLCLLKFKGFKIADEERTFRRNARPKLRKTASFLHGRRQRAKQEDDVVSTQNIFFTSSLFSS